MAIAALLIALLAVFGQVPAHADQTVTTTVTYNDKTTTRGTPWQTYFEGTWESNSTVAWAEAGAFFEIPFTGESFVMNGRTRTTNGTAEVYVDDVLVGTANYLGANSNVKEIFRYEGLEPGDHVLRVVAVGWVNHSNVVFSTTVELDERGLLGDAIASLEGLEAADYTAASWNALVSVRDDAVAAFENDAATDEALVAARTALEGAAADLIDVTALRAVIAQQELREESDHTAASWAAFSTVLAEANAVLADADATAAELDAAIVSLREAESALVRISGLRDLLTQYATRVPSDFTAESWAPFAQALTQATSVAEDGDASSTETVDAKNALLDAAAALVPVAEGSLESITNNQFWHDTDGNPIFSQGGGIFRFGDTYYWYGVRYTGAQEYYDNPSKTYDATFDTITAYSSKDLVNWTFENDIATTETPVHIPASKDVNGSYFSDMETLGDTVWIGRLGVVYNENTGKYVLLTQFENQDPARVTNAGTLFLSGDSPVDDFEYANLQTHIPGVYNNGSGYNQGTGDQTVFTDDDGTDYLVFSYRSGRSRTYVAKISDADSLSVEQATEVFAGAGREGNAMFKLDGQYYIASSDLHGWNTSQTYLIRSLDGDIQGDYSDMYVLPGTERDYSHVTQSGFFVTVKGTEQDTVIYAGDRWADFAWNGLGYNQWLPLSGTGAEVSFNSLSQWNLNATTGEWEVGFGNNYVLNPDFAADRIIVSSVVGWPQVTDPESPSSTFVTNVSPGPDGSRFALQLGTGSAFSGGVYQDNEVPAGVYTLALKANRPAALAEAQVVVTGSDDVDHVLDLDVTDGWATASLEDIVLPAGTARVTVRAAGDGASSLKVDALSLRLQAVDTAELDAVLAEAAALDRSAYTAASLVAVDDAVAAAGALLESVATQAEIDEAVAAVAAALAGLVEAPSLTLRDIATNPFKAEIEWLAATGVTTGWATSTPGVADFRPLSNVNRDQMAAFLYRLAGEPSFDAPATPTFLDVPTDYVFYKEIEWLATTGVTEGWTVDEGVVFRPRIAVNRDVMAAFLYRYAGSPTFDAPAVSPFVDVKTNHVFYKEIAWLNSTGISQGWTVDGDKQFRTTAPVKRDVMAAFLFRYANQFLED